MLASSHLSSPASSVGLSLFSCSLTQCGKVGFQPSWKMRPNLRHHPSVTVESPAAPRSQYPENRMSSNFPWEHDDFSFQFARFCPLLLTSLSTSCHDFPFAMIPQAAGTLALPSVPRHPVRWAPPREHCADRKNHNLAQHSLTQLVKTHFSNTRSQHKTRHIHKIPPPNGPTKVGHSKEGKDGVSSKDAAEQLTKYQEPPQHHILPNRNRQRRKLRKRFHVTSSSLYAPFACFLPA